MIVLVGLAVRIAAIGRTPLWIDEAISLMIAHWPAADLMWRPVESSPGLYYLVVKFFVGDPASAALARVPSLLFGTAAIVAGYAVGRQAVGRRGGLLVAALIAFSPNLIDYSVEGRPYAMALLLVLGSAIGFARWCDGLGQGASSRGALALFAVAGVAALYTHFSALFWTGPAMLAGYGLADRLGSPGARRDYRWAAVAMVVALMPEFLREMHRAARFGGFGWLRPAGPFELASWWSETVLPSALWGAAWNPVVAASAVIGVAVAGAIGWRLWLHRAAVRGWAAERPGSAAALLILLAVPITVDLFSYVAAPILMTRTLLLAIPGLAMLLALVDRVEQRTWLAPVLVTPFVAALVVGGPVRPREDWQPVAALLHAQARPGDALLVCPQWRSPPLLHALGGTRLPVYLMFNDMVMLMPPPLSTDRWIGTYWRATLFDLVSAKMEGVKPSLESRLAPVPGRVWLVDSECATRPQLERWLGPAHASVLFDQPSTNVRAGIRLVRYDLPPMSRPVSVPRWAVAPSGGAEE